MLKALRSVVHSFIYSFVHSFIHLLIHSFIHSFVHSFFRSLVHLFIRLFVCLFVESLYHSFVFHLWCCHNISSFFIKRPRNIINTLKKNVMLGLFLKEKPPTLFKQSLYTNARNKQIFQKPEYQETHPNRATDKRRFSSMDQRCLYD